MKNIIASTSVSTAALCVITTALFASIVVRLVAGTQRADLLATAAGTPSLPEVKLDAPPLDAHLESLREHAHFYASRAFYVAPPPPAATSPARPAYLLTGTFAIPHKHTVALLKQSATGNVLKVKPGDDLEGWHVDTVENARVVLRYHDERFEIGGSAPESGTHVTRAPMARPQPGSASMIPAAATGAAVATQPVKSLGHGGTPFRNASLPATQSSIEARLYRPPPK